MHEGRLAHIDALRGIAILAVIAAHSGQIADVGEPLSTLTEFGNAGVQLFFVVSAFTILMTFDRATGSESNPVRNFLIRRCLRLFPVYWLGILVYTSLFEFDAVRWKPASEPWHFPLHATLLNLLHPNTTVSVVTGGWSISCEFIFYLTVPLWCRLVRNTASAVVFVAASILIGVLVLGPVARVVEPLYGGVDAPALRAFWFWSFPSQLACFSFGIMLFHLVRGGLFRGIHPAKLFTVMSAAAIGLFSLGILQRTYIPPHHLFGAGYLLVGLGLTYFPIRLLVNPVTTFLGRISFSAYLLHFLVLIAFGQLAPVRPEWIPPAAHFLLVYSGAIIATAPIAYVSMLAVERPSMQVARSLVNSLETRASRAADKPLKA